MFIISQSFVGNHSVHPKAVMFWNDISIIVKYKIYSDKWYVYNN